MGGSEEEENLPTVPENMPLAEVIGRCSET